MIDDNKRDDHKQAAEEYLTLAENSWAKNGYLDRVAKDYLSLSKAHARLAALEASSENNAPDNKFNTVRYDSWGNAY